MATIKEDYLAESEDEKIREAIIYEISLMEKEAVVEEIKAVYQTWLAWLEKQGEKPQGKSALEAAKEEKVDNQNCVNPADESKIKPKFKTGDRVIGIVSGMSYFITEVCDDHYNTESGCIIMFCSQDNFEPYEQKPAEWSEEDEKIALSIEQVMNCASLLNIVPEKVDKIRTWLKSLRPQNTWRPSDEQLNNILDVLSFDNCTPKRRELLESLYNDLRKLRE